MMTEMASSCKWEPVPSPIYAYTGQLSSLSSPPQVPRHETYMVCGARRQASVLFEAMQQQRIRQFLLLLEAGVDANCRNEEGDTPLIFCCNRPGESATQESMVTILLAKGADPNLRDRSGKTALMHASTLGNRNLVLILLQNSSTDHTVHDPDGRTAYSFAEKLGHEEVLNVFRYSLGPKMDRLFLPEESIGAEVQSLLRHWKEIASDKEGKDPEVTHGCSRVSSRSQTPEVTELGSLLPPRNLDCKLPSWVNRRAIIFQPVNNQSGLPPIAATRISVPAKNNNQRVPQIRCTEAESSLPPLTNSNLNKSYRDFF